MCEKLIDKIYVLLMVEVVCSVYEVINISLVVSVC